MVTPEQHSIDVQEAKEFEEIQAAKLDPTKPYPGEYVHGAQKPSIGRIVHYYASYPGFTNHIPLAAVICWIEEGERVNLCVYDKDGDGHGVQDVPFRPDNTTGGVYWTWPPKV